MLSASVSSHRLSASLNLMFREWSPHDRPAAARAAGFAGAEFQFLGEFDVQELARALREADLSAVLVNVDLGDLLSGGPGLSGVPGRESEFATACALAAESAAVLGARFLHVGPSRIPSAADRRECLQVLVANLHRAAPLVARQGLQLLVETMNPVDVPDILLSDPQEVAALVRNELAGVAGLMFDCYHVSRGGHALEPAFLACRDVIAHVQFSDCPGRGEPGTGETDFAAVFGMLQRRGYSGWIGAEYTPRAPTLDTLGWRHHLDAGFARERSEEEHG